MNTVDTAALLAAYDVGTPTPTWNASPRFIPRTGYISTSDGAQGRMTLGASPFRQAMAGAAAARVRVAT